MEFDDEVFVKGEEYINFKALEISKKVDIQRLNFLVDKKYIEKYYFYRNVMIRTTDSFEILTSQPGYQFDSYFKKSDLEGLRLLLPEEAGPNMSTILSETHGLLPGKRMSDESFVKSLRDDIKGIWDIVRIPQKKPNNQRRVLQLATEYLATKPNSEIKNEDISSGNVLNYDRDKPKRAMYRIVQNVLRRNKRLRNKKDTMGLRAIEKILSSP